MRNGIILFVLASVSAFLFQGSNYILAEQLSPLDEITAVEAKCLVKMLDLAVENENVPAENKKFMSPKMQIFCGISPDTVQCNEGLKLIFKSTDGSPACIKPETAEKLIQRGWAIP